MDETASKRLRVLELIEAGEITVEQGVQRLEALGEETGQPLGEAVTRAPGQHAVLSERPAVTRVAWQAIFWTGLAQVVGGGLLVYGVHTWDISRPWLPWGWVILALGVVEALLGLWLWQSRWLSVRVQDRAGPRIAFALPVPLGFVGWGMRVARPFVPQLREAGIDDLVLAMQDELRDGSPLFVEVNDEADGDHVQIYFG